MAYTKTLTEPAFSLMIKQAREDPVIQGLHYDNKGLFESVKIAQDKQDSKEIQRLHDTIILLNLPLVVSIAKKFRECGMDLDDLVEEGIFGLIQATKRFDENRECTFATYASSCIENHIKTAIRYSADTIRITCWMHNFKNKVYKAQIYLGNEEASSQEIATYLKITPKSITLRNIDIAKKIIADKSRNRKSLSEAHTHAALAHDSNLTTQSEVVTQALEKELLSKLPEALEKLSEERQYIIKSIYGIDGYDTKTKKALASELGIKRDKLNNIIQMIIKTLAYSYDTRNTEHSAHAKGASPCALQMK